MTDNDLHTRLVAALQARLERARAAKLRTGWYPADWLCRETEMPPTDGVFIAANDPATEIRRVEALLQVVERHAPEVVTYALGDENVECHECAESYPCWDIRDIAAGEGIEP
ncbi:MAG TPA: hypothetical protein VF174_08955 [Micromonosporaceae bacterium]